MSQQPPYPGPQLYPAPDKGTKVVWIVVGAVAAVLLLCGLGVVGFAFSAFHVVSTIDEVATAAPRPMTDGASSLRDPGLAGAVALGDSYLQELRARSDLPGVDAPRCDGTTWDYGSIMDTQTFSSIDVQPSGRHRALATLTGRIGTTPSTNLITFEYAGGSWCIAD